MSRKLAALVVCLLALPSSAAAVTNDIGRIAYTSDRDGNSEIYAARVDGYGETNLTNDPATDQSPDVSADGSRIAFVSDRDGRMDVWVIDSDGSEQHRVTTGDRSSTDADPAWSPGRREHRLRQLPSRRTGLARLDPRPGERVAPAAHGRLGRLSVVVARRDATRLRRRRADPPGRRGWERRRADHSVRPAAGGLAGLGAMGRGHRLRPLRRRLADDERASSFSPDWSVMLFQRQEGVLGSPELYYMNLSEGVAYPAVTSPGRNFAPSWGPTYVAPPPPPPADTTPPLRDGTRHEAVFRLVR